MIVRTDLAYTEQLLLSLSFTFLDLLMALPFGRQDLSNEPNGYACQGQLLSGLDRRIQTCRSVP